MYTITGTAARDEGLRGYFYIELPEAAKPGSQAAKLNFSLDAADEYLRGGLRAVQRSGRRTGTIRDCILERTWTTSVDLDNIAAKATLEELLRREILVENRSLGRGRGVLSKQARSSGKNANGAVERGASCLDLKGLNSRRSGLRNDEVDLPGRNKINRSGKTGDGYRNAGKIGAHGRLPGGLRDAREAYRKGWPKSRPRWPSRSLRRSGQRRSARARTRRGLETVVRSQVS